MEQPNLPVGQPNLWARVCMSHSSLPHTLANHAMEDNDPALQREQTELEFMNDNQKTVGGIKCWACIHIF